MSTNFEILNFGIERDENHGKPTFDLKHVESYGFSPRPVSGKRRSPHTGRIVPRSQIGEFHPFVLPVVLAGYTLMLLRL